MRRPLKFDAAENLPGKPIPWTLINFFYRKRLLSKPDPSRNEVKSLFVGIQVRFFFSSIEVNHVHRSFSVCIGTPKKRWIITDVFVRVSHICAFALEPPQKGDKYRSRAHPGGLADWARAPMQWRWQRHLLQCRCYISWKEERRQPAGFLLLDSHCVIVLFNF